MMASVNICAQCCRRLYATTLRRCPWRSSTVLTSPPLRMDWRALVRIMTYRMLKIYDLLIDCNVNSSNVNAITVIKDCLIRYDWFKLTSALEILVFARHKQKQISAYQTKNIDGCQFWSDSDALDESSYYLPIYRFGMHEHRCLFDGH